MNIIKTVSLSFILGSVAQATVGYQAVEALQIHQEHLRRIAFGHVIPRALHVTAELGLADLVPAEGDITIAELAAKAGTVERNTLFLLQTLSREDIFSVSSDSRIQHTPRSLLLRKEQEGSMHAMIAKEFDPARWNALGRVDLAIRSDEDPFAAVNGLPFYDYLDAHPEAAERFNRGMKNYAANEEPVIVANVDFSSYRRIVDIGGGMGGLLKLILARNPQLKRALNVEMSETVKTLNLDPSWQSLGARVAAVPGNFFEAGTIPQGYDAYIMKRVLHNWNNEKARLILTNVAKAMPVGGELLVMEGLVGREGAFGEIFTLSLGNMKKRTSEEIIALCTGLDLVLQEVRTTESAITVFRFIKG